MFKINDRVKVVRQRKTHNYESTYGAIGFIKNKYPSDDSKGNVEKYSVELFGHKNPASSYGYYYFEESELQLVDSVPTLKEIRENELTCVINTKTQEEADMLTKHLENTFAGGNPESVWSKYGRRTCYWICKGKIDSFCDGDYYYREHDSTWGLLYDFAEIIAAEEKQKPLAMGTRTKTNTDTLNKEYTITFKEEHTMPNKNNEIVVTFTDGEREELHKVNNNGHSYVVTKKIKTISTTVSTMLGTESTTCDKELFDEYTGVLVAAAKITVQKSEEAWLIYLTAIDMWGSDMCVSILKSLANRATGGHFERTFKEWKKKQLQNERIKDIANRTCAVCKKVFNTAEEAREHEKWHEKCRIARQERKEAKRRLAEYEREGRISEYIAEIIDKRNTKAQSETINNEGMQEIEETNEGMQEIEETQEANNE